MKYISRSQWYCAKIDEFLKNPEEQNFSIELYTSEVKRIEKKYPQLEVKVGPKVITSSTDLRHACFIVKK